MISQADLFDLQNLAATVEIPAAPVLVPHDSWPYPGLTPVESAQACISGTDGYADMLAAVIKSQGGAALISKQVMALIPDDWRALCGKYISGSIGWTQGEKRGIKTNYVPHDGGGSHFTFQAINQENP